MFCAVCALFAAIELGTPFADHAVLQRGMKVPVWGRATPGNSVTVSFAGQERTATVDERGAWRVDLAPLEMSRESRAMTVRECERGWFGSTVDTVEVADILVGEVWFASGQSNMECPIWGPRPSFRDGNGALVVEMANMPEVRWYKNEKSWSLTNRVIRASWHKAVASELRGRMFSAVAFYYARELHLALGIPIGIVDSSWGGSGIDPWTPQSGYDGSDPLIADSAKYALKPEGVWKKETDARPAIAQPHQQPTVMFRGMVASWAPMAMRGFIWYQGCHNNCESGRYCAKLHALYNGWTREFGNPNLKMYLSQLAPYSQNWVGIAAAQNRFVAEQPNAALAVISDSGNFDDIHPNQKEIVAKRLAVHALRRDYGFDISEDDSPVLREATFDGAQAKLAFDHVKNWYVYAPSGSRDMPFELAGTNGEWQAASVANLKKSFIEGDTIVLTSSKVKNPVRARYMGKPRTAGTLYNEVSLPLGPFECSAFEPVTPNERLARLVAEDIVVPVRPGGVNGQPFWNGNAVWFMYPPAFDFPEVPEAKKYRFRVFDATGRVHDFTAASPKTSLAPVWAELPTGKVDVWCEGTIKSVGQILKRSYRSFYKMEPFRPGTYPKPPRGFGEAAKLGYAYLLNLPALKTFAETGRPDPKYDLNCYPSKIHAATVKAMLTCARNDPAHRKTALKLARTAGDYLLSIARPEGTPLAGFTPTYEGKKLTAERYAGQNMLDYPCRAGEAFLALYKATGDRRYFVGAERIAATYLRLQGEDGTWYLKLWEKDGASVVPNRLHPQNVIDFLDAMFAETGKAEYRASSDRAFAFIEKGPMTDWNWEGQFEDVRPAGKYVNMTKHPACSTAIRLVTRWPNDPKRIAQARDLLRFAEDQFVCWRRPFRERKVSLLGWDWEWLVEPGVVEQYHYREMIDASIAKLVKTYLALYRATGNPLDRAKAEALGGALVRAQMPSGRIPTVLTEEARNSPGSDWLNCTVADLEALTELSALSTR